MESELSTPMDSIKDVVRSSVKVPEFNKHLKKAGGHIGRNVVEFHMRWINKLPDEWLEVIQKNGEYIIDWN